MCLGSRSWSMVDIRAVDRSHRHGCVGQLAVVVAPAGELDLATAPRILDLLRSLAASEVTCICVDLADVTFADSAGMSPILDGDIASAGHIAIIATSPAVDRYLDIWERSRELPRPLVVRGDGRSARHTVISYRDRSNRHGALP